MTQASILHAFLSEAVGSVAVITSAAAADARVAAVRAVLEEIGQAEGPFAVLKGPTRLLLLRVL